MTDYLVLTEFVPGTKAKAQEVNANFSAVKDAINSKAVLAGDNSQTFSVAAATLGEHAVNKNQLDTEVSSINEKIETMVDRFCLISGNLSSGEADLLSFTGTSLSFKIGGAYPSLVLISANGTKETVTSLADITGLSTNGTYSVIKELGETAAIATSSNVTQGKTFPDSPSNGDYHCLTATGLQTYKRVSGDWMETQYIIIGTVTVESNVINSISTQPYNQNGYDVNWHTQGYKFPDYPNRISKALNTTFTADTDGWFSVYTNVENVQNNAQIYINNLMVSRTTYQSGHDSYHYDGGIFPIAKGQTYRATSSATTGLVAYFIPLKGVL